MSQKKNIRLSKCSLTQAEKDSVLRVLNSDFLGMGPEVFKFEKELSEYIGDQREVVCVNTGTSALHIVLASLDIGYGDEVLVPSLTYVASYQAISATGATPISCDVSLLTGFLCADDARKKITSRTKAIMPVHYASDCRDIDSIYNLADEFGLRVIEDAAHSIGGCFKGKRVGASGDIVCFSFDGIKNITSGEGGAVVTGDKFLASRVRDARLLGVEKDSEKRYKGERSWTFDINRQGFRYHMSDVMAAIGSVQLERIEELKKRRQDIVKSYINGLQDIEEVSLFELDYSNICPHIFVIKVSPEVRENLRSFLKNDGIATGVHYFPNHKLSLYSRNERIENVEKLVDRIVTLPLHPDLTNDDIARVIEKIRLFFK